MPSSARRLSQSTETYGSAIVPVLQLKCKASVSPTAPVDFVTGDRPGLGYSRGLLAGPLPSGFGVGFQPEVGQQLVGRGFCGGWQLDQQVAKVGERFGLVRFSAGHDPVEDRGSFSAVVAAEKQKVLAADCARPNHALAEVVIDRQRAVFAVARQAVPTRQDIVQGFADGAFG